MPGTVLNTSVSVLLAGEKQKLHYQCELQLCRTCFALFPTQNTVSEFVLLIQKSKHFA